MRVNLWHGFLLGLLLVLGAQAGEWHDAAEANDVTKLKSLLAADSKLLNSQDGDGKTALHRAAARGNLDAAKFLVESGADVNLKSASGMTALKLATGFGRTEVAEFLKQHGATSESAPSKKAAVAAAPVSISSITNTEKLNAFQRQLVQAVDEMRRSPERGFTSLHDAAREGQVAAMQALLARGNDINARDELSWTPLHWAANAGQKTAVECLLDHKADINALTTGGDTPLMLAIYQQRGPVIQTLLDRKAAPDASTNRSGAALSAAAERELVPVVVALLQAGADVNRTNLSQGWTALHWAAYRNNQPIVETLLAAKPRLDIVNTYGETPLQAAEKRASQEIVDLLRKAAGLPVTELTPTEEKIIAAYRRFENTERRGTLSEIRTAIFAQEPTPSEQVLIFGSRTNLVSQSYASRKQWLQGIWERRTSYNRPTELASRVELLPPSDSVRALQKSGWINRELPIYLVRVWFEGLQKEVSLEMGSPREMTYCLVNDHLVKLPDDVVRNLSRNARELGR